MSRIHGHTTPEVREAIIKLEDRVRSTVDMGDLLDLAQLYFEPAHRDDQAAAICELVLALDPGNSRAQVGVAYAAIHNEMTEAALRQAVDLLEEACDDPNAAGVANMLLAEALEDLGELTAERKTRLLELSVAAEPGWVANRRRLARTYAQLGRCEEAKQEMSMALRNLVPEDAYLSPLEESFHTCFTGRTESSAELTRERDQLCRQR
jgi:tetratricopeptide (TPR) repeat protein